MRIIGIAGKMKSGKDTFAQLLKNEILIGNPELNVQIVHFADKLKEITKVITGISGITQEEKNQSTLLGDTVREVLQKVGIMFREHYHPDFWINIINIDPKADIVIIPDVRFKNEVEYIKRNSGLLFKINRKDIPESDHISEHDLDDYTEWTDTIKNNESLRDLQITAKCAVLVYGLDKK